MGGQRLKKKIMRRCRQWQERKRDEKIIVTNTSISFIRKSEEYYILCVAAQVILTMWDITVVDMSFITLVTSKCSFFVKVYTSLTSKWRYSLCIFLLFLFYNETALNHLVSFDFLKSVLNFCFKLHSDFTKWLLVKFEFSFFSVFTKLARLLGIWPREKDALSWCNWNNFRHTSQQSQLFKYDQSLIHTLVLEFHFILQGVQ